jgi:predicted metallo-beta-lactamase superfamily hydrolase
MGYKPLAQKRYNLICNKEEMEMLEEIAKTMSRSRNNTLQILIRQGYRYFVEGKKMIDREKEVVNNTTT